jgi:hypothetical protein
MLLILIEQVLILNLIQLTFNGVAYVAKRCYTIGSGSPISIIANRDQLVKEGITLGRAKYFLDNFNKECDNEGIEISGVSLFPI